MVWRPSGSLMDDRSTGVYNNAPTGKSLSIALIQTLANWASPSNYTGRSSMTVSGDTISEQSADFAVVPGQKLLNNVPGTGVWSWKRWTRTVSIATGLQIGEASADHSHFLNLNVGNLNNVQKSTDAQQIQQGNSQWWSNGVIGGNPMTQPAPGNSFFCFGNGLQSTLLKTPNGIIGCAGDHVVGPTNVVKWNENVAAFVTSGLIQSVTISAFLGGMAGNHTDGNIYAFRHGNVAGVGGNKEVVEYSSALAVLNTYVLPFPAASPVDSVRVILGRYAMLAMNAGGCNFYDMQNGNALVGNIASFGRDTIWVGDDHLFFPATNELWQVAA